MFYYLLIPTFLIFIFLMPLFFEIKITLDVKSFSGVISVFLFKIKLHHLIYKYHKGKIIIQNAEDEEGEEFDFSSREVVFYKQLVSDVFDKTRLKQLFVFYNIGLNDAYLSAMVAGFVNSILLTFFTTIKNSKPTASLGVYDTVSYNRQLCEFAVKIKVSVTLFDMLYSLLNAYIVSVRFAHNEKIELSEKSSECME